jgi:hypothetical protein
MKKSVGLYEIFLLSAGHAVGQFKHLLVLLLGLEQFNLLRCFLRGLQHHRSPIRESVQLDLHGNYVMVKNIRSHFKI